MKKIIIRVTAVLIALLIPALIIAQTIPPARSPSVAITRVAVIDVATGRLIADQTVLIERGLIVEVGPSDRVKAPRGANVINASGKFLIPGLWDMHVHLSLAGKSSLALLALNGVTSARDMGGDFQELKLWREQISAGSMLGPRIKTAGPILESARFVERLKAILGEADPVKRVGIASPADARQAVESVARLGVDFLKIRTNASRDTYFAIAAEARRVGLPLVGHAPTGVNLIEVADAGHRSLEHGVFLLSDLKEEEMKESIARLLKNDTHVVPTLISGVGYRETADSKVMAAIDDTKGLLDHRRRFISEALAGYWRKQMELKKSETPLDWTAVRDRNLRVVSEMHRAGVKLMAGTDLAVPLVYPGWSLHEELELLVKRIGMTPVEALRSATRVPAKFTGMEEKLGTIEKGKIADLVILDANPLVSITNTKMINAVVIGGRVITRAESEKLLRNLLSH